MDAHDAKPSPSHYEQVVQVPPQIAAHVKETAFAAMDQLDGWCAKEKADILMDMIFKNQPNIIVEIGVFGGKSLVPMAFALKANGKGIIYGIDPWDSKESIKGMTEAANKAWWGGLDHEAIRLNLAYKLQVFKLGHHVQLIKNTSEGATPIPNIDILHLDGNHSEEPSYFDVTKWAPLVKSGGWIILDDITWCESGVFTNQKTVDWLNEHCIKFGQFHHMSDWGIWIKP
jgi:predicted O-methyltransferase YrrM